MKEEKEIETLDGFNIPLRELTEEEATRDITFDRFQEYHYSVGEDFVDQHESIVDYKVLGGWLLAKYPEHKVEICRVINDDLMPITQDFLHLYTEIFEGEYYETEYKFYTDFAEFLNLTGAAKKRVNQILIQVDEYYNGGVDHSEDEED